MTRAVIPDFKLNKNIDYRLLSRGGHVGFLAGSLRRPRFWLEHYLPAYYRDIK
jgi:predicted alpha/beta-fold hydrolase